MAKSQLLRMDNIGIVVDSLDDAVAFFTELGLTCEGKATIEGEWAGRVTGLGDQHVEVAMMVTPDGHSRLELSRFLAPTVVADHRTAPVNALGYLRAMFTVSDLDDTLARLEKHGARLVGEVVKYEEIYRLCYIRGPEGLLIGLAEPLGGVVGSLPPKLIAEVEGRVDLGDTLLLFNADHSFGLQVDGGCRGQPLLEGYDAWKAAGKKEDVTRLKNVLLNATHTGEDVAALATGAGAERVRGYFPNTHLFKVMMDAWGWKADAAAR